VQVGTADGNRRVAEWVVGADGARSAVRAAIGVAMDGGRSENAYVIVDVDEDPSTPRPLERVFHYEHPAVGGRNVLLVPFRGGWRVDLQCRTDDDPADFERGDGLRSWLAAVMGDRYVQRVAWVSRYRFLQVVADAFSDASGRVLLAGEAAHLFAPFGARGMNSGIADAHAAAAAIHAAREGGDRELARAAVDGFAQDRRSAALAHRRAAGQALVAIEGRRPWPRAKRRLAVTLAPRSGRAATWLDSAPYGPRLRGSRRSGRLGY
jgi:3-(3-hydroxy-phenyl)propionate hydroxylase